MKDQQIRKSNRVYLQDDSEVYLTASEIQCLKYLVNGFSVLGTANILNITERTVRAHIESCKLKLKSKTLFQLGMKASKILYNI